MWALHWFSLLFNETCYLIRYDTIWYAVLHLTQMWAAFNDISCISNSVRVKNGLNLWAFLLWHTHTHTHCLSLKWRRYGDKMHHKLIHFCRIFSQAITLSFVCVIFLYQVRPDVCTCAQFQICCKSIHWMGFYFICTEWYC